MNHPTDASEPGPSVGAAVPDWRGATPPSREPMQGRYCRLEPLDAPTHARQLWNAFALDERGDGWTFLPYGPFADFASFAAWLDASARRDDTLFFAIVALGAPDEPGEALGMAAFLRADADMGTIEVGHLHYSPRLQRTRSATEAMFLMMRRAFELGYRRYEWKCNALNRPSWRAALRLGFTFEGVFRQAAVVKGHNRDTAWFSVLDREWPQVRRTFDSWLAPENFDAAGQEKLSLGACREERVVGRME